MNNLDVRHICTAEDHQTAQDCAYRGAAHRSVNALATIQEQNRRLAVLEHRVRLLEAAEVAL